MKDKIVSAFDAVKADEALKENTRNFLNAKRRILPKRRQLFSLKKAVAFAICLLTVTLSAAGVKAYYTESAYISIDINPSIELGINNLGRVISQTAYNEEAEEILQNVRIKNLKYTDAVKILMESGALSTYLSEDSVIDFSVISDDTEAIIEALQTYADSAPYIFVYTECSTQTRNEAHSCGMSFGKYALYQELCRYDDSITIEDCKEMSVGEIMKTLKAHQNGNGGENNNGNTTQNDTESGNQDNNGNENNNGNNGNGSGNSGNDSGNNGNGGKTK